MERKLIRYPRLCTLLNFTSSIGNYCSSVSIVKTDANRFCSKFYHISFISNQLSVNNTTVKYNVKNTF